MANNHFRKQFHSPAIYNIKYCPTIDCIVIERNTLLIAMDDIHESYWEQPSQLSVHIVHMPTRHIVNHTNRATEQYITKLISRCKLATGSQHGLANT